MVPETLGHRVLALASRRGPQQASEIQQAYARGDLRPQQLMGVEYGIQ